MRKCFIALILIFSATAHGAEGTRTLGFLAGFSFPKYLVGKVQLNLGSVIAIDYQASLGYFWTIQQGDLLIFFWRDTWSPYIGVGYQYWRLQAFTTKTTYNNVPIGDGATAVALSAPLGLQFVASNGFAFDVQVAGGIFVNAPTDLENRAIVEMQATIGYFF